MFRPGLVLNCRFHSARIHCLASIVPRTLPRSLRLTLPLLLAVFCLHTRGVRTAPIWLPQSRYSAEMPRTIVWAWEEPEDLRAANPQKVGVAFLAARVFVGKEVSVARRHQPIEVPEGIWADAVVRIEAEPGFEDTDTTRNNVADAILSAARLPRVRGVQVDFDATASQRQFYANVLQRVRAGLPASQLLEITALVSWCARNPAWFHGLPIDAAVPMEFRLGEHVGQWGIAEPLCMASMGISTDEPLPSEQLAIAKASERTLYVFSPRPWTESQLQSLNQNQIPRDERER